MLPSGIPSIALSFGEVGVETGTLVNIGIEYSTLLANSLLLFIYYINLEQNFHCIY